jgi:hypothetical protein
LNFEPVLGCSAITASVTTSSMRAWNLPILLHPPALSAANNRETFRNGSTIKNHALIMSHFDPSHVGSNGEMDVITLAMTVLAATHFKKKKYHPKPQHLSISTEQSRHDEVLPKPSRKRKGTAGGPGKERRHEEKEGFEEEGNDRDISRPLAGEISHSISHDCDLTGLVFISRIEEKNKCFIPSTKNYFGGIQVRKVLCDYGCSTTLLPLEEDQIISLFLNFPMEDFLISVVEMSSSAGRSSVLRIEYIDFKDFHVKLCQDLVGNCVSMSVEVLAFSLCSSDIKTILQTPALLERLTQQDAANLRRAAVEQAYQKRRTHAV